MDRVEYRKVLTDQRSKVYVNLVEHAQDNKLETRNKYIFNFKMPKSFHFWERFFTSYPDN